MSELENRYAFLNDETWWRSAPEKSTREIVGMLQEEIKYLLRIREAAVELLDSHPEIMGETCKHCELTTHGEWLSDELAKYKALIETTK